MPLRTCPEHMNLIIALCILCGCVSPHAGRSVDVRDPPSQDLEPFVARHHHEGNIAELLIPLLERSLAQSEARSNERQHRRAKPGKKVIQVLPYRGSEEHKRKGWRKLNHHKKQVVEITPLHGKNRAKPLAYILSAAKPSHGEHVEGNDDVSSASASEHDKSSSEQQTSEEQDENETNNVLRGGNLSESVTSSKQSSDDTESKENSDRESDADFTAESDAESSADKSEVAEKVVVVEDDDSLPAVHSHGHHKHVHIAPVTEEDRAVTSEVTAEDDAVTMEDAVTAERTDVVDVTAEDAFTGEDTSVTAEVTVEYRKAGKAVTAEVTAEDAGVTAEDIGVTAEDAGFTAEDAGVTAEVAGVTAEDAGVTAEDAGVTAENEGVTAEDAGLTAENAGLTAENAGLTAEDFTVKHRKAALYPAVTAEEGITEQDLTAELRTAAVEDDLVTAEIKPVTSEVTLENGVEKAAVTMEDILDVTAEHGVTAENLDVTLEAATQPLKHGHGKHTHYILENSNPQEKVNQNDGQHSRNFIENDIVISRNNHDVVSAEKGFNKLFNSRARDIIELIQSSVEGNQPPHSNCQSEPEKHTHDHKSYRLSFLFNK